MVEQCFCHLQVLLFHFEILIGCCGCDYSRDLGVCLIELVELIVAGSEKLDSNQSAHGEILSMYA
jgi:hypothetical protein